MNSKVSQKSLDSRKYRVHLTNTTLIPTKGKTKGARPRTKANDRDQTPKTKTTPLRPRPRPRLSRPRPRPRPVHSRPRPRPRPHFFGLETRTAVSRPHHWFQGKHSNQ